MAPSRKAPQRRPLQNRKASLREKKLQSGGHTTLCPAYTLGEVNNYYLISCITFAVTSNFSALNGAASFCKTTSYLSLSATFAMAARILL